MKRCPQCGAEYDDYVQYCFVDGAELAEAAAVAAPSPPGAATPAPVPSASAPGHAPPAAPLAKAPPIVAASAAARPVPSAPRPSEPTSPPAPSARSMPVWALLMVLLMLIAAFGFVSLAGALLVIGSGTPPPPEPVAARPAPPPPPPVAPTAPPSDATPVLVDFDSDPPGATILEGDPLQPICTTPCRVPQPEYAPAERNFVLRLDGYADTDYKMTDPSQAQHVKITGGANRGTQKTGRRPGGGDDILLGR